MISATVLRQGVSRIVSCCAAALRYTLPSLTVCTVKVQKKAASFQTGQNQSPIDIMTSQTTASPNLKPLIFNAGWNQTASGTAENTGYYLKFAADSSTDACTLQTYNGDYVLDHFHYHWGQCEGEGAEHYLDGKQYDIEFHFVHKKVGMVDSTLKDSFLVLGVFGQADAQASVTGIWKKLSPMDVLDFGSKKAVDNVVHSSLLPVKKDYFHYEGSLTTPSYAEVVHWFVLKEPISVPTAYLDALRKMKGDNGKRITKNFRELQDVSCRTVQRFRS